MKYTICNLDMIVCVCVCDHIRFLFAYTMLCYVRCIRVNLWCDIANHRDSISCRVQVQIYVHIGPLAIRHGTNLNCRCVDCGLPCVLLWHIFFSVWMTTILSRLASEYRIFEFQISWTRISTPMNTIYIRWQRSPTAMYKTWIWIVRIRWTNDMF